MGQEVNLHSPNEKAELFSYPMRAPLVETELQANSARRFLLAQVNRDRFFPLRVFLTGIRIHTFNLLHL